MPLYELDGVQPDLAGQNHPNDQCWVAPMCNTGGQNRFETGTPTSGSALCYVVTTKKSLSVKAAMFRI